MKQFNLSRSYKTYLLQDAGTAHQLRQYHAGHCSHTSTEQKEMQHRMPPDKQSVRLDIIVYMADGSSLSEDSPGKKLHIKTALRNHGKL